MIGTRHIEHMRIENLLNQVLKKNDKPKPEETCPRCGLYPDGCKTCVLFDSIEVKV